jgi:Uma2 family endonuclease
MVPNVAPIPPLVVYPERDGKPMSDNMTQARWITLLYENLEALFAADPNVLVAADNLIYPDKDNIKIRQAPDVYVVFGRPKGDRGSYIYHVEENIPVTVAFEILSPGNTHIEMADKLEFYDEHGIEEYYVYDPATNRLLVYRRQDVTLVRQHPAHDYVSPRLGIRFDLSGEELVIRYPDGRPFVRLYEAQRQLEAAEERARQGEALLARMRELSRKARRGEATHEELAELDRLEVGGG